MMRRYRGNSGETLIHWLGRALVDGSHSLHGPGVPIDSIEKLLSLSNSIKLNEVKGYDQLTTKLLSTEPSLQALSKIFLLKQILFILLFIMRGKRQTFTHKGLYLFSLLVKVAAFTEKHDKYFTESGLFLTCSYTAILHQCTLPCSCETAPSTPNRLPPQESISPPILLFLHDYLNVSNLFLVHDGVSSCHDINIIHRNIAEQHTGGDQKSSIRCSNVVSGHHFTCLSRTFIQNFVVIESLGLWPPGPDHR